MFDLIGPDGLPPRAGDGFEGDPLGYLLRSQARLGPVLSVRVDGAETVVVAARAGVGELFAQERGRLEVLNTPLVHDLFGKALFNLTGTDHHEARRLLRSPMTGRALACHVAPLFEVASTVAERWARQSVEDLHGAAREVTLVMSTRVLLGIHEGELDAAAFRDAFERFVVATSAPGGRRRYISARYWAGRRARADLHALFARRTTNVPHTGSGALAVLAAAFADADLALGPLADHLLALLIAARETTASLITWTLAELAQHPYCAEKAAAEARSAAAAPGVLLHRGEVPYLRAVLAETQRLHSPNLLSMRRSVCPIELGGFTVPAGARVAYSPSAGHFEETVYPEPFAFRPERFTLGEVSPTGLLAFGGGAHACLGRPLAELMVLAVLVAVLNLGRPCLPDGPPVRVRYRPAKAPLDPLSFALDRAREPAP